jgi:hypothetical protein
MLTAIELGCVVMRALRSACLHFQPTDRSDGRRKWPMPSVRRLLSSPRCLPHLAQVVLTAEPSLVAESIALLRELLVANPTAAPSLYRTGFFYFALAYGGSDIVPLVRLLQATHMLQTHWLSSKYGGGCGAGGAAGGDEDECEAEEYDRDASDSDGGGEGPDPGDGSDTSDIDCDFGTSSAGGYGYGGGGRCGGGCSAGCDGCGGGGGSSSDGEDALHSDVGTVQRSILFPLLPDALVRALLQVLRTRLPGQLTSNTPPRTPTWCS